MTDPSTDASTNPGTDGQPGAPDPGNTDPQQLVAPLPDDDDAVAQLTQLFEQPDSDGDDTGDDDPLGY